MKNKKAARPKGKPAVGGKKKERLRPVSLHPLSFEEAMAALINRVVKIKPRSRASPDGFG
jgi:hypothetical protein